MFLFLMPAEDQEALLTRLMDTYGSSVLRVCFLYLHDHALAQDAAQSTFVKVWKALGTLRQGASEKAWVMRIAVNTCKNMLRSRSYRQFRDAAALDSVPEPSVDAVESDDTVLQTVMSLPEAYRDVVVLHYYQGLPTADIARILRIPKNTVLTRLHRARKLLEDLLKGWYLDDE